MPRAPVLKSAKKVTKPKKTTAGTPTLSTTDRKAVAKPKKSHSHPTYEEMIARAIMSEAKRGGSSRIAIARYLQSNFDLPEDSLKGQLKLAISRLVSKPEPEPRLIQVKGSFRVSKELRQKIQLLDKSKSLKQTAEATPTKSVVLEKPAKATPSKRVTPRKSSETTLKKSSGGITKKTTTRKSPPTLTSKAVKKITKTSTTKTTPKARVRAATETTPTKKTTTVKTPTEKSPKKTMVKKTPTKKAPTKTISSPGTKKVIKALTKKPTGKTTKAKSTD
eukprot:TRINITY_DN137_c0_g1_i1.p1 TRINITY_DN137_c0_g1~~TRINITY_DN137_c0_g1_i1.p1  ORF type:complete len:277 (-),score=58.15 TRINITY_DN137_c0_g1_i1:179-1009(-)